jgi:hypothetical protein
MQHRGPLSLLGIPKTITRCCEVHLADRNIPFAKVQPSALSPADPGENNQG